MHRPTQSGVPQVAAHRAEANVEKRMAIEAILLILRTAEAVEWVDGIRQPQLRI
jgi:hypothetical protein